MKEIQTKSGKILCVKISEDSDIEEVIDNLNLSGNNKYLGKLSELTGKDCEEFVEKHPNIAYRDYTASTLSKAINEWTVNWNKDSAKGSFISLLESEGVDTSIEYLVIKVL